jgi:hypothetical protein
MRIAAFLGAAAIALTSTVSFAQNTTTEYYVVQDTSTKKCMVVDKKPATTTTVTVVGDTTVYKTKTDAEAAMKKVQVCM